MREDWTPAFLAALSQNPNVTAACAAAGISRMHAYRCKNEDPEFAAAWEDAHEQAVDHLAGDAWRRAKGEQASDTLTIFLLKSHRPQVYREAVRNEHSGGVTIRVQYDDDPEPAFAPTPPRPA